MQVYIYDVLKADEPEDSLGNNDDGKTPLTLGQGITIRFEDNDGNVLEVSPSEEEDGIQIRSVSISRRLAVLPMYFNELIVKAV